MDFLKKWFDYFSFTVNMCIYINIEYWPEYSFNSSTDKQQAVVSSQFFFISVKTLQHLTFFRVYKKIQVLPWPLKIFTFVRTLKIIIFESQISFYLQ